jgi:hypothetical protein
MGKEEAELRPSKGLAAQPIEPVAPPTPAALRRRRRVAYAIAAGVLLGGVALAIMVNDEADEGVRDEAAESADGAQASGGPGPKAPGASGSRAKDQRGFAGGARVAGAAAELEAPAAGNAEPGTPQAQPTGAAFDADGGAPPEGSSTETGASAGGKSAGRARNADGGAASAAAPGGRARAVAAAGLAVNELGAARDGGVSRTDAQAPRGGGKGAATATASAESAGPRAAGGGAPSGRAWVNERSRLDEEDSLTRLDRFVAGGSTLTGRVVAAETGKPIEGATIHAHSGGAYVEAYTDASGTFRVAGMPAKSHAIVWVDRPGGSFIDERIEISIGAEGQATDAGTIRLLRGDERRAHAPGWVGLFVSRRGTQLVAGAVSAWLPADKADIQVGDELLQIDGQDTAGLGPRAATFLLRGPVGTHTKVVVRGHGTQRALDLERVPR